MMRYPKPFKEVEWFLVRKHDVGELEHVLGNCVPGDCDDTAFLEPLEHEHVLVHVDCSCVGRRPVEKHEIGATA